MFYKDVIFYNHYGTGDLWASREFIKELMEVLPASNFHYAHSKDHHLFFDFPNLSFYSLDNYCDMRKSHVIVGDTLYINTWIGYAYGKYVYPGVSVTLDNIKRMFNDTLSEVGLTPHFTKSNLCYVPKPDYSFLNDEYITNIGSFIFNNVSDNIVLISNGDVWSNQAKNFAFAPIITNIAVNHPTWKFIVTEDFDIKPSNVYLTKDIIGKHMGSDLPEISYLSTYVDLIIGRSSGPFVFTQTQQNYNNENIKILSFTYQRECGHMLKQVESKAKLYWSNADIYEDVLEVIYTITGEKYYG